MYKNNYEGVAETTKSMTQFQLVINERVNMLNRINQMWSDFIKYDLSISNEVNGTVELLIEINVDILNESQTMLNITRNVYVNSGHYRSEN